MADGRSADPHAAHIALSSNWGNDRTLNYWGVEEMRERRTFAQKVTAFNAHLDFGGELPKDIYIMNPFVENTCASPASAAFYNKYYNDYNARYAIMGINPGRFGAGITGVPFTDPKRLKEVCGINLPQCPSAHEPSSQFVYAVISAYGGPEAFYGKWYINSFCPLGFVKRTKKGGLVNFNYYDNAELAKLATPFIVKTLEEQLQFPLNKEVCFCLGAGKNFAFIERLNGENGFFDRIIPLPHPRFIAQYHARETDKYVREYLDAFSAYAQ